MNKIKSILVSVIAFLIMSITFSCTEETTINTTDSAYVPVIYGTITDQNIRQQIQISSSSGYFDKEQNRRISNAIVTLKEDSSVISHSYVLTQDSVGSGIYLTHDPVRGKTGGATASVTMENSPTMTELPKNIRQHAPCLRSLKVDSFNITKKKVGEYTLYSLNISAQDQEDEENYYFGKILHQRCMVSEDQ